MDGNSQASPALAPLKAQTANGFRTATHTLAEANAGDPARIASIAAAPGFTVLGGGVPLRDGDTVIGAIGVGGGSPAQDVEVAEAGAAALSVSSPKGAPALECVRGRGRSRASAGPTGHSRRRRPDRPLAASAPARPAARGVGAGPTGHSRRRGARPRLASAPQAALQPPPPHDDVDGQRLVAQARRRAPRSASSS